MGCVFGGLTACKWGGMALGGVVPLDGWRCGYMMRGSGVVEQTSGVALVLLAASA